MPTTATTLLRFLAEMADARHQASHQAQLLAAAQGRVPGERRAGA